MNFLVDAQLPRRVTGWLAAAGAHPGHAGVAARAGARAIGTRAFRSRPGRRPRAITPAAFA